MAVLAGLVLGALAACSPPGSTAGSGTAQAGPGSGSPSSTTSPSSRPSSVVHTPLTCADLVSGSNADAALASPSAPIDFTTVVAYPTPFDFATTVAGGIHCAWLSDGSRGRYSRITGGPGVAWLDVQVLPHAAHLWTNYTFGDSPGTAVQSRFAGVDGAHSCGDPGCTISAPIGDAWVIITVMDPGLGIGESLVGTSDDDVLAKLTPAATALFATVRHATSAQLDWPNTKGRAGDSRIDPCASFLKSPVSTDAKAIAQAIIDQAR
jgi:hypothetical protein